MPIHNAELRGALVTGGSRGIGAATALQFGHQGVAVVVGYRDRRDAARDVVARIEDQGGAARAVRLDVTDEKSCAAAFADGVEWFAERSAGLDVVVAAAGVFASAPIIDTGPELWQRLIDVNARGVLLTLQQAARHIRDGGRVVAISSVGTRWPSAGEAAYAASKGAVEQLVRVASREFADRGVTVNAVAAGPTDTDLFRAAIPATAVHDVISGVAHMTALGRMGTADEVAGAIVALTDSAAGWMTGQIVVADGGLA